MPRTRDTGMGTHESPAGSTPGDVCPLVPSPLLVPRPPHTQAPWRSGRSSPSTLAATPARPATRQARPTNTWSSLCKVGPPSLLARQPRPLGQGAGAELEAGGAGDPRLASDLAL